MVFEPAPTMADCLGTTPFGGSAMAGAMVSAIATAAAEAVANSFVDVRMFLLLLRTTSRTFRPTGRRHQLREGAASGQGNAHRQVRDFWLNGYHREDECAGHGNDSR